MPLIHPPFSASSGFTTRSVRFDGSLDWLSRGAALTGAANGQFFLASLWIKVFADSSNMIIFEDVDGEVELRRMASNALRITLESTGTANLIQASSATALVAADGWVHYMISARTDTAPLAKVQMYRNGVDDESSGSTEDDGTIDFTGADWGVGGTPAGSTLLNAELADVYIDFRSTFFDLGIASNRAKFRNASGKPVDLGADGTNSGLPQPIMYFSLRAGAAVATFGTNKGTGGGFTVNGTLAEGSSSPSD